MQLSIGYRRTATTLLLHGTTLERRALLRRLTDSSLAQHRHQLHRPYHSVRTCQPSMLFEPSGRLEMHTVVGHPL